MLFLVLILEDSLLLHMRRLPRGCLFCVLRILKRKLWSVGFALLDENCDGFLTREEFLQLVLYTLWVITTCSQLANASVHALQTNLQ